MTKYKNMTNKRNKKKLFKRLSICIFSLVFIAGITLLILDKSHTISLFSSSSNSSRKVSEPKQASTSTSTSSDSAKNNPTIASAKSTQSNNSKSNQNTTNVPISITITSLQIVSNSINIGTLVDGTNTGTCTLQFIQDNYIGYSLQVNVIQQNNLYTCNGFSVNTDNIPTGSWSVKVLLNNNTQSTSYIWPNKYIKS